MIEERAVATPAEPAANFSRCACCGGRRTPSTRAGQVFFTSDGQVFEVKADGSWERFELGPAGNA